MYSIKNILEVGNGNKKFVHKILNMFVDEIDGKITNLKSAMVDYQYTIIADITHQLKTNMKLLGRDELSDKAEYIEKSAKQEKCSQKCFEYLQHLIQELLKIKKEIQTDLKNGKI